jgi:hypothetical protein
MPYKRVGKTVMHKKDGWSKKQTATSVENAEAAMRLLQGVEHGWKPTGAPAKKKKKAAKHHSAPAGKFYDDRASKFGVE